MKSSSKKVGIDPTEEIKRLRDIVSIQEKRINHLLEIQEGLMENHAEDVTRIRNQRDTFEERAALILREYTLLQRLVRIIKATVNGVALDYEDLPLSLEDPRISRATAL